MYIAKNFISEHDSHEMEGWEVSIGPEEGKKAFHLLFYRQLKSVEGIACLAIVNYYIDYVIV